MRRHLQLAMKKGKGKTSITKVRLDRKGSMKLMLVFSLKHLNL